MNILVLGSGGREHALVWALVNSPSAEKIYVMPGSLGMKETLPSIELVADGDPLAFCEEAAIDLVVIGPEAPLVAGVADILRARGIAVFGPSKAAAQLEGSKSFAKDFMARHHIPTAAYASFTDSAAACAYVREQGAPIVVKADGLAAGKGVVVAETVAQAEEAIHAILDEGAHGGASLVIEEFMAGEEASLLSFVDGETVVPLLPAQDHKRLLTGDKGPNTGGMGAYAPAPCMTTELVERALKEIVGPTVKAMAAEGHPFQGCLYTGLMLTDEGPKVVEFNARFGDPETQAILPLLASDFAEICMASAMGTLDPSMVQWREGAACCVVLASAGYPTTSSPSVPIIGDLGSQPQSMVFQAGTTVKEGQTLTKGGRVLGVTAWAEDLPQAIEQAYGRLETIDFEGKQYRTDIGAKGLKRH